MQTAHSFYLRHSQESIERMGTIHKMRTIWHCSSGLFQSAKYVTIPYMKVGNLSNSHKSACTRPSNQMGISAIALKLVGMRDCRCGGCPQYNPGRKFHDG
eukprot:scaffold4756_cov88-Cylindrotheca_fusiformis.AAC.2